MSRDWYIPSHTSCTSGNHSTARFSYLSWMFVFMASVNYTPSNHGSLLKCVICHDIYWGNRWETIPWKPFTDLVPKCWSQQSPSQVWCFPWDQLFLQLYRSLPKGVRIPYSDSDLLHASMYTLFKNSVKSTRQTRSLQHSALSFLLQWD